jgi:thymidylate synthase (FAD)
MIIVQPYARLLTLHGRNVTDVPEAGILALRAIEWAGRISHRSEEAQTPDSWERFIRAVVLGHGDWSIVEHVSATVDMRVDRGITHEIVRHRLFSYTQESTRFVNYEKRMPPSFICPEDILSRSEGDENSTLMGWWVDAIEDMEDMYRKMIRDGASPQIARSVFPNALASRIIMTGNLRNWRHFFIMRTTKEAHPQMRQVTIPLLAEFKQRIPILFEDIEPMARQVDNLKLPR